MKQSNPYRVAYLLIAAGTLICCAFNEVMAGVLLLLAAVGVMAGMWLRLQRETDRDEIEERIERLAEERYQEMLSNTEYRVEFKRYVGLGKGYENKEEKA